MQPLFTIHAGEYLVGSFIERHFKNYNVWVPAKDTGIDLLVTNSKNDKTVSLQVKYSKDWAATHMTSRFHNRFRAWGWWTLNRKKIKVSKADLWVFVMQSFTEKSVECIILSPKVLLGILESIHGKKSIYQTYMWVRNDNTCWETRELSKKQKYALAELDCDDPKKNLTCYLNN
ncbi:MAG: hypothetical protein FJ263_08885 [Planctomycetes bacterium]|nr:hypothetical protein [Planctomycetota bacterium]